MTVLPLSRLTVLGAILLLPGLYFGIRFLSGWIRVLSRKFRRGKPYLQGSATDYFLYASVAGVTAALGACLTLASAVQAGFQPLPAPREIGQVWAKSPGEGRIHLRLELEKDYPGPGVLEVDLSGVRWALDGAFLAWRPGPTWMGFLNGHRIESALGSRVAAGPPDREADSRGIVSGTYALWYLAHRHAGWVPMLRTARFRTPWMPADGASYRIFAGPAGYVLVEERKAAGSAAAP